MMSLSDAIRSRRNKLGLSTRDLAALADIAYPTLSRIENGHEQPRWDTATAICDALGIALTITNNDNIPRLASIRPRNDGTINWTKFRALADHLVLHPEHTGAAIGETPPSRTRLFNNLRAATAEHCADRAGIQRPAWTRQITPLSKPWEAPGTPRMQAAAKAATPDPFAARNLFLHATTIWRDRELLPT